MLVTQSYPDPVTHRITDIPLDALIKIGRDALVEFEYTINKETPDASVVGVALVGSTLTTDFVPQKSDLDMYFITTAPYASDSGFWQFVNDETCIIQQQLNDVTPDVYDCIDCLGIIPQEKTEDLLRDPHLVKISDFTQEP